jgi:hypothetical protein
MKGESSKGMDRRHFMKLAALATGSVAFAGERSFARAQQRDAEPESPIYIALNTSKVTNSEESFRLMKKLGPRVCITTATHPGFVGFQANIQTGILPLAGRYGGGKVHMEKELNPVRNYQYTMWKRWEDHDEFHLERFDQVFELCANCLGMVVEGPWEPVYRVVKAVMPPGEVNGPDCGPGRGYPAAKGVYPLCHSPAVRDHGRTHCHARQREAL